MGIQGMRVVGDDMPTGSGTGGSDFSVAGQNVWAKPLVDGSWALALLNNDPKEATVSCGYECWSRLQLEPADTVRARVDRLSRSGWKRGTPAADLSDEAWAAVQAEAARLRGPGGVMALTGGWGNAVP